MPRLVFRLAISVGLIGIVLAVCLSLPEIHTATAALMMVLVIVGVAKLWGRLESLTAALIGGLAFDYCVLPPRGFALASPEHWIDLAAFLVTAVVAGQFVAGSKRREIQADMRNREAERRAQAAIGELNVQLKSDLSAMTRMQQLSTRLVQAGEVSPLLEGIIEGAMEITGADMGNIQLLEDGVLKIVAQRGFEAPFLDFFRSVPPGISACGVALQRGRRVIVEDVESSPVFDGSPALEVMRKAGVRAIQATPLVSRGGQILGMFSTHYRVPQKADERDLRMLDLLARQVADLIERVRAEEAIRRSEAQFHELAELGPRFIWICRPGGPLEYVNRRWTDYSGLGFDATADAAVLARVVHPEDWSEMVARGQRSLATGKALEIEARLRRADGEFRWFLLECIPIRDDGGRIVKWFGAATDIHEQKRVEEELRRANEIVRRSQDLKSAVLAAVAHEIRNPLNSIKIAATALLSEHRGSELSEREMFKMIDEEVDRMDRVLHGLVQMSRVDTGELTLNKEPQNLGLLIHAAIGEMGTVARGRSIQISVPDSLPLAECDKEMIARVLRQLLGNALKYSPLDTPLAVSAQSTGEAIVIDVVDRGPGVADDERERIFEKYYRGRAADTGVPGTGLGLASAKTIVQAHGGEIWVTTPPAGGAAFHVSLPLSCAGKTAEARS